MKLKYHIKGWNGKDVDFLELTWAHYSKDAGFQQDLLDSLALSELHQSAASWLLRRSLQRGNKLAEDEAIVMFNALPECEGWAAQLNLLQCMELLPVPPESRAIVELYLRGALADSNKFVRAWAYNGFYLLAQQYPELRPDAQQLMTLGLKDEPAAVKARIRNAMKKPLE